jgi:P27 family predicted phage terminase small subunit
MAGRPPKASALRLIEGNRGKRAINKQEPDPSYLNDLAAPEWLPVPARAIWDELAPHLRAAKMLTTIDVQMLCKGCIAIAQYRHATKMLGDTLVLDSESHDECGVKVVTKAATLNQWMVAQSMAFKQAMAVMQQFGMSPAARTRIAIQPQGDLFGSGKKASGDYFT